jgi:hypothetical protein
MLTDPTGAATAYIGLTSQPVAARVYQHLTDISGYPRNRKSKWLRMLLNRGLRPIVTVLDTVSEEDSADAETDAIAMCRAIRGFDCVNTSVGRRKLTV